MLLTIVVVLVCEIAVRMPNMTLMRIRLGYSHLPTWSLWTRRRLCLRTTTRSWKLFQCIQSKKHTMQLNHRPRNKFMLSQVKDTIAVTMFTPERPS